MEPDRLTITSSTPRISPTHIWIWNMALRTVANFMTPSCVGPTADKIVIKPGQRDDLIAVAQLLAQGLNGVVELKQHGARSLVADHALDPEEGGPAAAPRHRRHMMLAGGGIDHQVARG